MAARRCAWVGAKNATSVEGSKMHSREVVTKERRWIMPFPSTASLCQVERLLRGGRDGSWLPPTCHPRGGRWASVQLRRCWPATLRCCSTVPRACVTNDHSQAQPQHLPLFSRSTRAAARNLSVCPVEAREINLLDTVLPLSGGRSHGVASSFQRSQHRFSAGLCSWVAEVRGLSSG